MNFTHAQADHNKRFTALAAMLCVHGALVLAWHYTRPAPAPAAPLKRIDLWFVQEKAPAPVVQAPIPMRAAAPVRASRQASVRPPARVDPAPAATAAGAASTPATTPAATPAVAAAPAASIGLNAEEMLRQARGEAGAIDRELRKQVRKGMVRAPVSTPYTRFVKGVELAHELAPPKWYEAPKIQEVIDPGQWGRKRTRVITAFGTYCITNDSNRPRAGNDVISKRPEPIMSNCPEHEQPATTQP